MKIIKTLSCKIEDELEDAESYAKLANELKDERPGLAKTLYTISTQEMDHMRMLHEAVEQIIAEYREEKGDPPAAMQAVYEFLHARYIDKARDVKTMQALFRGE